MYLGALNIDKGIIDAIHIFSIINRKDPGWQFWIAGHGDSRIIERVKGLISSLGLTDKITFWGFVDEKKKFELLAKAHILLNPSIREGWGLVNIEANSAGTPV